MDLVPEEIQHRIKSLESQAEHERHEIAMCEGLAADARGRLANIEARRIEWSRVAFIVERNAD